MTPQLALAIGVVWGALLVFALGLCRASSKPVPPVVRRVREAQERQAAEDFRPRLHGVADVVPVRSRGHEDAS
jgi:hypothetical protein